MSKIAVFKKTMIKQDYKSPAGRRGYSSFNYYLHHIKLRWGEILAVAIGVILLSVALSSDDEEPVEQEADQSFVSKLSEDIVLSEGSLENMMTGSDEQRLALNIEWDRPETESDIDAVEKMLNKANANTREVTIKSGDSLSSIFIKQGFSAQDVYQVTRDITATQFLKNIIPGKKLLFHVDSQGMLQSLDYQLAINENLHIERTDNGFSAEHQKDPIEIRHAFASGIIKDSLFNAGKNAGLSDTLVVKLANIFGWDIDFVLDVRENDSFAMIYEQQFLDGVRIGDGDIIAAQFVNQGEVFQAVRYTNEEGFQQFYAPDGNSMRKAFLRAPLSFLYISSNFKPRRFHPILKRWKAHKGIDYRAPTGTPVYAAGDGKVIASSYSEYNGKFIFIQHGNNITTKYLHLSRRTVSHGARVKQGQVIGYVGATGLAEAPHLHYEFVVGGVHRNPKTVKLPQAEPIKKQEFERFKSHTQALIASLEARDRMITTSGGL